MIISGLIVVLGIPTLLYDISTAKQTEGNATITGIKNEGLYYKYTVDINEKHSSLISTRLYNISEVLPVIYKTGSLTHDVYGEILIKQGV